MKTKLDKKHVFLALFVVALTVFALTATSSATSQTFRVHDTNYVDASHIAAADGTTHSCDKAMDKTTGCSGSEKTLNITSTSTAWWYNDAAQVNSTFGESPWWSKIYYTSDYDGTVTTIMYLVRDNGTIIKQLADGSKVFSAASSRTLDNTECADNTSTNQDFNVGQRLAVRISYSGTGNFTIHYASLDACSHIDTPETDPGFPVPELPTIILMSTGLLALAGFVLYSRSRRRNGKAQ